MSFEALDAEIDMLTEKTAFERIVEALSARERSSHEIRERLVCDGFSERVADASIERAQACGLLDDQRYRDAFVSSKLASGWGRKRIERELERQGIELGEWVGFGGEDPFDRESEIERASALLARKSVPDRNPVEKLAQFLVTRGFDATTAYGCARERVKSESGEGDA